MRVSALALNKLAAEGGYGIRAGASLPSRASTLATAPGSNHPTNTISVNTISVNTISTISVQEVPRTRCWWLSCAPPDRTSRWSRRRS